VFRTAQDADETSWQEMLVRHLGLTEWIRIEHHDELDLIGPYARRVLTAHGLLWPANSHFHLPLLDVARGGSMLTGIGGDELYCAAQRLRAAAVLSRRVPPRPRDMLSIPFAVAPRAIRRTVIARRSSLGLPWLRPAAIRRVTELMAAEAAAQPRRLTERMKWWHAMRYLRVGADSIARIAEQTSTLLVHPLLAPRFWGAVAAAAAPIGFADRGDGVRRLFADLLPPQIIERSSKANFDLVFWTDRARTFAREWDGSGVPDEWVDRHELARHWAGPRPIVPSSVLLQAAWLGSAGRSVEQALEGAV
jgi:asparagine synthase (glutamine-hydrolysing)